MQYIGVISMNNNELMSKIFGFSSPTYFRWKKENRPIINLIEKYFSKKDLKEFLETGEINKFNYLEHHKELQKERTIKYLSIFKKTSYTPHEILHAGGIQSFHTETINMYTDFLIYLSNLDDIYDLKFSFFKFISEENENENCFERYDYAETFNYLINSDSLELLQENIQKDFLPMVQAMEDFEILQEEALTHALFYISKKYNINIRQIYSKGLSMSTFKEIFNDLKTKNLIK